MRALALALVAVLLMPSAALSQAAPRPKAPAPSTPHRFAWVLEGGTVAFGFDVRPRSLPQVGIRTTAGIKFSSNASENADIGFMRIPVEVVGSYDLPRDWRVGAGLACHTGVSFNGDGFVPDVDFDPATGLTLEVGWKALALTCTTMEYSAGGAGIDASAIGVSAAWVFRKKY